MQVQLSQISLALGGRPVLAGVDLETAENEYVVILGPSGCGKTTTLRIIAGLQRPDSGEVRFDGVSVTHLPPRRRGVAMVFQHSALYPHLTVEKFIRLGQTGNVSAAEWESRFRQAVELTRIGEWLGRYPDQLSGGQLRRAALAKAIVRQSAVRLLDEPLAALDAYARPSLQEDILRWHRAVPGATIHVTHDGDEAMRMADRIAVLDEGRILQFDCPDQIYRRPHSVAVATVIGSPSINLLDARIERGRLVSRDPHIRAQLSGLEQLADGDVRVGIRPESFRALPADDASDGSEIQTGFEVEAQLLEVRQGAHGCRVVAQRDGQTLYGVLSDSSAVVGNQGGARIRLRAEPSDLHLFDAGSGRRLSF